MVVTSLERKNKRTSLRTLLREKVLGPVEVTAFLNDVQLEVQEMFSDF